MKLVALWLIAVVAFPGCIDSPYTGALSIHINGKTQEPQEGDTLYIFYTVLDGAGESLNHTVDGTRVTYVVGPDGETRDAAVEDQWERSGHRSNCPQPNSDCDRTWPNLFMAEIPALATGAVVHVEIDAWLGKADATKTLNITVGPA